MLIVIANVYNERQSDYTFLMQSRFLESVNIMMISFIRPIPLSLSSTGVGWSAKNCVCAQE